MWKARSIHEAKQGGEANILSVFWMHLQLRSLPLTLPLSRLRGDWLSFVADSTKPHFQVNRLSFYLFNSAFTLLA